jgi:hypothetical protein
MLDEIAAKLSDGHFLAILFGDRLGRDGSRRRDALAPA